MFSIALFIVTWH